MTEIQVLYDGPIVKRADAIDLNLTHYFTGNPCKHGHVDQRNTKRRQCLSCNTMHGKNRWEKNKEELTISHREWRLSNLYKRSEYLRKWWSGREDERNERLRQWAAENPDNVKRNNRNNRENNPETKRMCNRRRRALEYNAEGYHTKEDISNILKTQNSECVYCGKIIMDNYHVDHIMPLALGGSNWPSNLQCLCPTCNTRKGAKHPDVWHDEIGHEVKK